VGLLESSSELIDLREGHAPTLNLTDQFGGFFLQFRERPVDRHFSYGYENLIGVRRRRELSLQRGADSNLPLRRGPKRIPHEFAGIDLLRPRHFRRTSVTNHPRQ